MNNQLIPVFPGIIQDQPTQLIDARLLHNFLEVGKQFATWITDRIKEYSFQENQDYLAISQKREIGHGRGKIDYHLTIDMAKELGMIERNEKGREIRRYFLEMERLARAQQTPIPYITEPEAQQFKKSIEHHCKNNSAKYGELYRKAYDHFGITSYKHIPHGKLEEAASICGLKLLKLSKPKPLGIDPPTQTGEYITRQEAEALCKQIMSRLPKEMPRQGIRHADKIAVPVNLSIYDIEYILNNHGYNLTKQH